MKRHQWVLAGIAIGIGFGIAVCLVALGHFNIPHLDSVIDFLGAPPTLMTFRLNLPEKISYPLLILYFSLIGFILSWLISSAFRRRWIVAAIFLVLIIAIHWETTQQINREFDQFFHLFAASSMPEEQK